MKNNNNIILIAALFMIIILLIFNNKKNAIIYCCNKNETNKPCSHRSEVPNYDNLVDAMLYYKLNDNCNFQTLVFQTCFDKENKAENYNAYSVLGRFNGTQKNELQYVVNTMEIKHFFLNTNNVLNYHIGGVIVLPESKSNHIKIAFQMEEGKTSNENLDYIYGNKPNEKPITIDKDANIDFFVIDSDSGILESIGCTDISSDSNPFLSGGYECNGRGSW